MSTAMELTNETLEKIGSYVRGNLAVWMRDTVGPAVYRVEPEILERLVRVEEEFKSQSELIRQQFGFQTERFVGVDRRFEQVDKRFEEVDRRFEQVDKRFDQVDKRFEQIATQISDQRRDMLDRFDRVDTRLAESSRHASRSLAVVSVLISFFGVALLAAALL